jgi:DNA-damage-inducible protein J
MIHKTATINVRIDPTLKTRAESVFAQTGLTPAEAIRLFYVQVDLSDGLPFAIKIPNAKTALAIKNAREGKNLVLCKNAKDMFKKLGLKCTSQSTKKHSQKI